MAFGGQAVDNHGVIRWFPAASMLTGLLANALGWCRVEGKRHQRLQSRLIFATCILRDPQEGMSLRDFQTVQLGNNDRGWTTRGVSEGRAGGAVTYLSPHLRYRDYFADMRVCVALRLEPSDESPSVDGLAAALQEPRRPLFIGRKPCLPSGPLFAGFSEADSALAALLATPLASREYDAVPIRLLWPDGEGADGVDQHTSYLLTDERNWVSGLHGGGRLMHEGTFMRSPVAARREGSQT